MNTVDTPQVSAVVLSLGAPTLPETLRHLNTQTVRPAEIIILKEGISPFHKAFNYGAGQVKSEYFIQVDEDMFLNPDCLEKLVSGIEPDVAVVVGHLEDPILGPIVGVKLFRTSCTVKHPLQDTVSFETDFIKAIEKDGWRIKYIEKNAGAHTGKWEVVGLHKPDYSPSYTFEKFIREGIKLRYRRKPGAFYSQLHILMKSNHENAPIAQLGFCEGIFLPQNHDILMPIDQSPGQEYFKSIQEFIEDKMLGNNLEIYLNTLDEIDLSKFANPTRVFKKSCRLGVKIRATGSSGIFDAMLQTLWRADQPYSWVAVLGVCHGIFLELDENYPDAEEKSTKIFLDFYQGDWSENKSLIEVWKKLKRHFQVLVFHD